MTESMNEMNPDRAYNGDAYQQYVATKVVANPKQTITIESPPGSGKSFVVNFLAKHAREKQMKKVVILTCNDALKDQLKEMIGPYHANDFNVVFSVDYMFDEEELANTVIIVDEADQVIQQHLVRLRIDETLGGFFNWRRAHKCYLLTATTTNLVKQLMARIPENKNDDSWLMSFPHKAFMGQAKGSADHNVSIRQVVKTADMIPALIAEVSKQCTLQPVIIFDPRTFAQTAEQLGVFMQKHPKIPFYVMTA